MLMWPKNNYEHWAEEMKSRQPPRFGCAAWLAAILWVTVSLLFLWAMVSK